ncbi:MAG TPA: hypothetical protein VLF95_05670 [Vicinamibacteria bacterium]|nr:hypothetical protein [Vicinamibacteria bacterium]
MKHLWIAGMVVAGAALALPAESRADWRVTLGVVGDYGHGRGGSGPAFRHGYDRGWREGTDEGRHDGRRGRDPRFWREGEYRDGDRGYKRWMGPRWDYAAGFRRGYEAGYRRAYASMRPGWRGRGDDRWDDGRYRGDDRRYDDRYRRDDDWRR